MKVLNVVVKKEKHFSTERKKVGKVRPSSDYKTCNSCFAKVTCTVKKNGQRTFSSRWRGRRIDMKMYFSSLRDRSFGKKPRRRMTQHTVKLRPFWNTLYFESPPYATHQWVVGSYYSFPHHKIKTFFSLSRTFRISKLRYESEPEGSFFIHFHCQCVKVLRLILFVHDNCGRFSAASRKYSVYGVFERRPSAEVRRH